MAEQVCAALNSLSPGYPDLEVSDIRSLGLRQACQMETGCTQVALLATTHRRGWGRQRGCAPETTRLGATPGAASGKRDLGSVGNAVRADGWVPCGAACD